MPTATATRENTEKALKGMELNLKGAEAASRFLYRRGYEILEKGYVCKHGKMDIIAKDGDTLVFCEVKTRDSAAKGFPSETIPRSKRDRLEKIALTYLSENPEGTDYPVRFDVIALVVMGRDRALIRHHINALSAPDFDLEQ